MSRSLAFLGRSLSSVLLALSIALPAAASEEDDAVEGREPVTVVAMGEPDAVAIVLEAWSAVPNSDEFGALGYADGPRDRSLEIFCRPPAPRFETDMLALLGRMTPEEFDRCGETPLIEIPLGAVAGEDGAPRMAAVYVRGSRVAPRSPPARFAASLIGVHVAGAGGVMQAQGRARLTETAREALAKAYDSRTPLAREDLSSPWTEMLHRPRRQADADRGVAASSEIMITGFGAASGMVAREARRFAEAQGHDAPEILYRLDPLSLKLFCAGEHTSAPDMLVLDRRMTAEEYDACQFQGHMWITEVFLGHTAPWTATSEMRPAFVYFKKAHEDAFPAVAAFLRHLVSEEVLGLDGRFASQGLAPLAPARRFALLKSIEMGAPLLSSAEFDTPVPEPYLGGKTPAWALDRVIDGPRHALVIGNAAYSAAMGPLSNPGNDARAVAQALEAVGFEVSLHEDLGFKEMRRAVRDFAERVAEAGPGATALFFFSGHGMQTRGLNFLAPVDAEIEEETDIEIEAVSANTVLRQIEEAGATLNLLILDACRNNTFTRETRSATRGLAPIKAEENTLIVYATRPGAVAYDGEGDNSPFTQALLEAIRAEGTPIEFALKDVAQQVRLATDDKQSPWIEGVLIGNFYFTPPG